MPREAVFALLDLLLSGLGKMEARVDSILVTLLNMGTRTEH
jgi:hypothetical protein